MALFVSSTAHHRQTFSFGFYRQSNKGQLGWWSYQILSPCRTVTKETRKLNKHLSECNRCETSFEEIGFLYSLAWKAFSIVLQMLTSKFPLSSSSLCVALWSADWRRRFNKFSSIQLSRFICDFLCPIDGIDDCLLLNMFHAEIWILFIIKR